MLDIGGESCTPGSVSDGSSSESADWHDHGTVGRLRFLGSAPFPQVDPPEREEAHRAELRAAHKTLK